MALFIMLINNVGLPGEMCCRGDFSPPCSLPWISAWLTEPPSAVPCSPLLQGPTEGGQPFPIHAFKGGRATTMCSSWKPKHKYKRFPLPPVLVTLTSAAALSDPFALLSSTLGRAGPCPPELLLFPRPGVAAWCRVARRCGSICLFG